MDQPAGHTTNVFHEYDGFPEDLSQQDLHIGASEKYHLYPYPYIQHPASRSGDGNNPLACGVFANASESIVGGTPGSAGFCRGSNRLA